MISGDYRRQKPSAGLDGAAGQALADSELDDTRVRLPVSERYRSICPYK
jgi:hypothetical protein